MLMTADEWLEFIYTKPHIMTATILVEMAAMEQGVDRTDESDSDREAA
jgi:hypothetical protein